MKEWGGGEWEGVAILSYLSPLYFTSEKLFWWHLVCHTFFSITFAFHGYSRSLKVHHCPFRWKRNWNQNRKHWEAHWIPNLKNLIVFLTKTKEQMLKNRKATNHNNHQKQKTKVFWAKTKTKTKTYLKIT